MSETNAKTKKFIGIGLCVLLAGFFIYWNVKPESKKKKKQEINYTAGNPKVLDSNFSFFTSMDGHSSQIFFYYKVDTTGEGDIAYKIALLNTMPDSIAHTYTLEKIRFGTKDSLVRTPKDTVIKRSYYTFPYVEETSFTDLGKK